MDNYAFKQELYYVDRLGCQKTSEADQVGYTLRLIASIDKFASERQFWIIEQLLKSINKRFERSPLPAPEAMLALAQNLPLSEENIFGLLGAYENPEIENTLVDNLFRFHSYAVEDMRIDDGLAQLVKDNNPSAIRVLDKLLAVSEEWEYWAYPVRRALSACFNCNEEGPIMQWFLDHEARLMEMDEYGRLPEDRSFQINLNMYDRGMKKLGRLSLDSTIQSARRFEYSVYESIVGEDTAMSKERTLDEHARLCYALVTEQPIEKLLDRLDYRRLVDAVALARQEHHRPEQDRVSRLAGTCPTYITMSLDDFTAMETQLRSLGYPMYPEDLESAYNAIAYGQRNTPMVFTKTFLAAADRDIVIHPEIAQEWPKPLIKQTHSWDDIEYMVGADARGSPMPRDLILKITDNEYGRWSKKERSRACERAPSWILAEFDYMAVARLEEGLGL